jgi:hypothetical protein
MENLAPALIGLAGVVLGALLTPVVNAIDRKFRVARIKSALRVELEQMHRELPRAIEYLRSMASGLREGKVRAQAGFDIRKQVYRGRILDIAADLDPLEVAFLYDLYAAIANAERAAAANESVVRRWEEENVAQPTLFYAAVLLKLADGLEVMRSDLGDHLKGRTPDYSGRPLPSVLDSEDLPSEPTDNT